MLSAQSRSPDARSRIACSTAQALAAGFQQSSRSTDCPKSPGSPVRLGSSQSTLGLGHYLRADGSRLVVSGRRARSLFMRYRRLGDAPPHAAGPAAATSHRAQLFTSGELLGRRRDGELLLFAEDRAGIPDALCQLLGGERPSIRLYPLLQSPPSPLGAGLSQSHGV